MGVEILAAAIGAVIIGGFAIGGSAIMAKSAKESAKKTTKMTLASQKQSEATAYAYQAEVDAENKAKAEELEKLRSKQLQIESQRYHIDTLVNALYSKQPSQPVIYQTAPAKEEMGLISQINKFFGGLFK